MPRCGATFDENTVPPWTRGTSGGFGGEYQPTPALRDRCRCGEGFQAFTPSDGGDFKEAHGRRNWDTVL